MGRPGRDAVFHSRLSYIRQGLVEWRATHSLTSSLPHFLSLSLSLTRLRKVVTTSSHVALSAPLIRELFIYFRMRFNGTVLYYLYKQNTGLDRSNELRKLRELPLSAKAGGAAEVCSTSARHICAMLRPFTHRCTLDSRVRWYLRTPICTSPGTMQPLPPAENSGV